MIRRNRSLWLSLVLTAAIAAGFVLPVFAAEKKEGYTDTPYLPGQKWRVHDAERPHPQIVKPEPSKTLGMKPPEGATVLFDGSNLDKWTGKDDKASWKVENGYAEINGTGTINTREKLGDVYLHLEFATPEEVKGNSQGRGNSGIILMGKYEIQVLDSYDNVTYADGQCAAIYGQFPPKVNASLPPGQWQTFDIHFQPARWDDKGQLVSPSVSTVYHNGVLVQDKQVHIGEVSHRRVGAYFQPHPSELPLTIQDHSNPVRFRNIWYRPLKDDEKVPADEAMADLKKFTEAK